VKPNVAEFAANNNRARPSAAKRNTWANGALPSGATMPVLPFIRPVSPLSSTVTVQAYAEPINSTGSKKIGRQLSLASHGNHYSDMHRQEAERALNGVSGLLSPPTGQKESFFSHLRKRARRISGRQQMPLSPNEDQFEANVGCVPWAISSRNSWLAESHVVQNSASHPDFAELDEALQNARSSLDLAADASAPMAHGPAKSAQRGASNPLLKRHLSLPQNHESIRVQGRNSPGSIGHSTSHARRAAQKPNLGPTDQYETPDEQEELLDEALATAHAATARLDRQQQRASEIYQTPSLFLGNARPPLRQAASEMVLSMPYPTPSPTAKHNNISFGHGDYNSQSKPIDINQSKYRKENSSYPFPTPPYDENDWAAAAAASIFAAGDHWT